MQTYQRLDPGDEDTIAIETVFVPKSDGRQSHPLARQTSCGRLCIHRHPTQSPTPHAVAAEHLVVVDVAVT